MTEMALSFERGQTKGDLSDSKKCKSKHKMVFDKDRKEMVFDHYHCDGGSFNRTLKKLPHFVEIGNY